MNKNKPQNAKESNRDTLQPEYDFSKAVRGVTTKLSLKLPGICGTPAESRRRNTMQVLRSIQTVNSDHISLKIPKSFMKRALEIIIMPIDDSKPAPETSAAWPKDFFARTAGCFAGTPLVREEQGEYEVRDSIR